LKANDLTLADASLTAEEFYSEKWLYRFLRTQYSERPHALWERYIDRMYPTHTGTVTVAEGVFTLTAVNHFVSACVLVPAKTSKEFDSFAAEARRLRVEAFEKTVRSAPARKPTPPAGDVPYLAFVPDDTRPITPHAGPSEAERARQAWKVAAAPSQRLSLRLAVVPFRDLGRGRLEVSDLSGPDTLSAKHARVYWLNHRSDGETISEMALVPGDALDCEAGVTQCFHVWWEVPADTRPGRYQGKWKFRPEKGSATELPVELEVYPFRLEEVLPFSFGMYYSPRNEPGLPEATQKRLLKEQLQFMRQVGFTAVPIGSPQVTGLGAGGKVSLRFDDTLATLAREVGMGRHPKQSLTGAVLPVGRAIGRRLPGSQGAAVDRQPGIELRQPEFRPYLQDALRQYRKHLDGLELPVAVEIRNLADTLAYADLVRAAGLTGFVTPMGDTNGGKDYTVLADHADIVSVHAWKASEGLMERTRKNGKTLWLYNTGMDRLSWGFYNWRAGSQGRWEWHFGWHEAGARGGYPGSDWYNPFTAAHGFTSHAPAEFPGGMLFQSAFLEAAEGITDTAYLVTLEKAMAAAQTAGRHPAVVKEARGFLDALRRVIPAIPGTKGLATPADGALVGTGIDEEARWQTSLWREKVAELIRRLQ
jgi:hypothetical protein